MLLVFITVEEVKWNDCLFCLLDLGRHRLADGSVLCQACPLLLLLSNQNFPIACCNPRISLASSLDNLVVGMDRAKAKLYDHSLWMKSAA